MGHGLWTMVVYSVRKLFTGFLNAALIAWKLTVANAMNIAATPATANTHHCIVTRYGKSCSHVCIAQYDNGAAKTNAISTSFKKFLESNPVILLTDAPNSLRTPISLIRFSAI